MSEYTIEQRAGIDMLHNAIRRILTPALGSNYPARENADLQAYHMLNDKRRAIFDEAAAGIQGFSIDRDTQFRFAVILNALNLLLHRGYAMSWKDVCLKLEEAKRMIFGPAPKPPAV